MGRITRDKKQKRSIFSSVFLPVFLIMLLQSVIFYLAAVYGGIEESLSQNAADILSGRLTNRKIELETRLNGRSFDLSLAEQTLLDSYSAYERENGEQPLAGDAKLQIQFLLDNSDMLIQTLRHNEVNGIFLILNDSKTAGFPSEGDEKLYGLNIRDIDQNSNYTGRDDLVLERAPSSIVDALGCQLDSWWEARYSFASEEAADYYYAPLNAAWQYPHASNTDLAYFAPSHQISESDQSVVSWSIPLKSKDGYPFAVLGVELTTKYLTSLLPLSDFSSPTETCYVLAMRNTGSTESIPITGSGALYHRSFKSDSIISSAETVSTGGFIVYGRGNLRLYADDVQLEIFNNNNPFENRQIVLLALAEYDTMFAYISRIKLTLLWTTLICLLIGILGILWTSRRFAVPITALAKSVRNMNPREGLKLERIGIVEIDQLEDSIEELNRNVTRSSARTEFFSRMSHDMRTPMNAIISFSSPVMLDGVDEATKDDYLAKIHASGDYLLGLINDVLDMTKIESNKIDLHPVAVQASRLCETTIPIIQNLAQSKKIRFHHSFSGDSDMFVMVDSQYFDQIIINLLSNAVKFTPESGNVKLSIELTTDQSEPESARCRIIASDNGIGMSEEFQRKLFTPFEQENSGKEGTGLGLSIVKRLVDLMNGTITCSSKKQMGTTFSIDLPLKKGEAITGKRAALQQELDINALKEALGGKHILVCEDYKLNVQIVCGLLSKAGIVSDVAENGQIGLDRFKASAENTYDAILMDIRMPIMDGIAATKALRALDRPDAKTIPVIAMTADAFDEDIEECRVAGMNEHLTKPIDTQKFFGVLVELLSPNHA